LPRCTGLTARALLCALCLAGCNKPDGSKPPPGEKPREESSLARTTLSAEDYGSLKIATEPARNEAVPEHRELSGFVTLPPGHEVTLTAPIPGIVRAPKGGTMPVPGSPVSKEARLLESGSREESLFHLEPMLAPLDRIQVANLKRSVESDLAKARETVTVAESELNRMRDLHEQKLRGSQDVEQAQARLNHARADLAAATDKQKLFSLPGQENGKEQLPPFPIDAPHGWTVLSVNVSPGQYVAAGTPLVTVADLSQLWLRVPVPERELSRVDHTVPVQAVLHDRHEQRYEAKPRHLVPAIDPDRRTADMLYEVTGPHQGLIAKDQLVSVFMPLGSISEKSLVPYSAIVFDAHGGTWVYVEKTTAGAKEHVFERRRVELLASAGKDVIVRPRLATTDNVVTSGAQELFSREFYKTPVDDDD
jgi:RND family efflux transporter MFP subunit